MHVETIKEPLDHDHGAGMFDRGWRLKSTSDFWKSAAELVFRLGLHKQPAGIGNQNFILIVNRDDDPALHAPFAGKEVNAKVFGRFFRDPSAAEVRV